MTAAQALRDEIPSLRRAKPHEHLQRPRSGHSPSRFARSAPGLRCGVCRQPAAGREARVERLFLRAAEIAPHRSFILGGEGWGDKTLPQNVRWIGHVPTGDHNRINCSASMVMNIDRSSMADFGFSPPTRVFEVAGAGACLLCDNWPVSMSALRPEPKSS